MSYVRPIFSFSRFIIILFFFLAGCGGGSGGSSASDPLSNPVATNADTIVEDEGMQSGDAEVLVTENQETNAEPTDIVETPDTSESVADGADSVNNVSGNVVQYGTVSLEYSPVTDETSLNAGFFEFDLPFSAEMLVSEFIPNQDVCTVTDLSEFTGTDSIVPDFFDQIEPLSVGEVIPFISPAGTYTELQRQEAFGFIFYQPDNDEGSIAGLPPEGLEFSIPGGDFASFSNVPVPVPLALQVTSPAAGELISANTEFSWNAGSSADSRITLSILSLSTSVSCNLSDDGQFEFPEEVQQEIGTDFFAIFSTISRQQAAIFQNDSSLLFVMSSVNSSN